MASGALMSDEKLARAMAAVRPGNRAQLYGWLRVVLGVRVPWHGVCPGHGSPLDYLEHVFFERGGDSVVWANRGGGKTFYGAAATLLDLVFKPGIEVRILGGSMEQSAKMYGYLREMLERPGLREMVDGTPTLRRVRLRNGSGVELLAQSEKAVRGHRVQKLRCDEVELFGREVWDAAQFVTRGAVCGGVEVKGTIEAMSTVHRPFGLMSELIGKAGDGAGGARLFQWCALDVMERCEAERECDGCAVWDVCGGRAKKWDGFLKVEDAIAQRGRSSAAAFESEMLCMRPSGAAAVYPGFDPAVHVRGFEAEPGLRWVGGMDFGMRNFVMIWAQLRERAEGKARIEIVDAYAAEQRSLGTHLEEMRRRGWPAVEWLGVDPAGNQRSDQTGISNVSVLRAEGFRVKDRRVGLHDGLEAVRRRLDGGAAGAGLIVHPRCGALIAAMSGYHFDPDRLEREEPVKDGHDHAADALRYLIVNLDAKGSGVVRAGY
jgi:hypothetical protein